MTTVTYRVDEKQTSNGAEAIIDFTAPYIVSVTIEGAATILLHGWNNEAVEEKAGAAKGSKAKKTDDLESYVYRTKDGLLGVAGRNMHGAIVQAGRFMQDPRSPRKSAMDLCKAGVVSLTEVAPFEPETKEWDFVDRQRVVIMRSAITRARPAMVAGWRLTFDLLVTTPEYLNPQTMQKLCNDAGRLCGLCDYRPTYGRFNVVGWEMHTP